MTSDVISGSSISSAWFSSPTRATCTVPAGTAQVVLPYTCMPIDPASANVMAAAAQAASKLFDP